MIVACHRLGKTTKTVIKFANRKDVELLLKIKKKLKDINLLEICSSTDGNPNRSLSPRETDSNSGNVDVGEKNWGGKIYLYQSLCPYNTFLYGQVKERYNERLFHDFWVTNGTIRIKEYEYSKPMDVTRISDL